MQTRVTKKTIDGAEFYILESIDNNNIWIENNRYPVEKVEIYDADGMLTFISKDGITFHQQRQYTTIDGKEYWIGPAKVHIPINVREIEHIERPQTLCIDGTTTRVDGDRISDEEYLQNYAELRNGKYFWKEY